MEATTTARSNFDAALAALTLITAQPGLQGGTYTEAHADSACKHAATGTPVAVNADGTWLSPEGETSADADWLCPDCVPVDAMPYGISETPAPQPVNHGGTARPAAHVTATPVAEVEAWLSSLGRKCELGEVTEGLRLAATEWAKAYTGDFEFMVEMRTAARRRSLSTGQAKGTLNCWRADINRRPAATAAHVPAEAPQVAQEPAAQVPEGRYAFTADEGHTAFCKVEHGKGNWEGRTFVVLLVGAPGHFRELKTYRAQAATILAKIAADGPEAACIRFGHEVGSCGRCGSPLTDPESIARGIGPTCASKGW
jgi:hypothetical protein